MFRTALSRRLSPLLQRGSRPLLYHSPIHRTIIGAHTARFVSCGFLERREEWEDPPVPYEKTTIQSHPFPGRSASPTYYVDVVFHLGEDHGYEEICWRLPVHGDDDEIATLHWYARHFESNGPDIGCENPKQIGEYVEAFWDAFNLHRLLKLKKKRSKGKDHTGKNEGSIGRPNKEIRKPSVGRAKGKGKK